MKQLKIVAAVVAFLAIIVWAASASAQEPAPRLTVDINYGANLIGHGFVSAFDYPNRPTLTSGKSYDDNGVGIAAKVAVTNIVSVESRYEHVSLRNAQFFTDDRERYQGGNVPGLQTEPDFQAAGGSVNYWEVSGSFKLPKTHGHSLVAGVAKEKLNRDFFSSEIGGTDGAFYAIHASHVGLVVGGAGKQKLSNVTFDYAGRLYPRMARRDYQTSGNGTYPSPDSSSFGYEVRGTATWMFANHIGLTGGYEFRRMGTDSSPMGANGQPWPTHENQDNQGFVVGTRFSF